MGEIGTGILVLLGVAHDDTEDTCKWMAAKIAKLRIFNDAEGKFNRSLVDVGGSLLVVSQFTLFADARKGARPSFVAAAPPEQATRLYEYFCDCAHELGIHVERGIFAAHMHVALVNDGPVTMQLER